MNDRNRYNFRTPPGMGFKARVDNAPAVLGGCCVAVLAIFAVEVWLTAISIIDFIGPRLHPIRDIVVFVVVGLLFIGSLGNRR